VTGAGPDTHPRFSDTTRARLREALLDAAAEVLRERGWRRTRMADVASRAGVSRQTLYQHFGARDAVAQALLLRETDRFVHQVGLAVSDHAHDAQAAVAAAFEVFLAAVADHVLIKSLRVRDGADEFAGLLAQHGPPLLEAARLRLETCFATTWPGGDAADRRLVAECVVRLAMSYLTLPSESPQLTGQSVARILGPFVLAATGTAHQQQTADG
jgi:AcrR family transcriptional regulator